MKTSLGVNHSMHTCEFSFSIFDYYISKQSQTFIIQYDVTVLAVCNLTNVINKLRHFNNCLFYQDIPLFKSHVKALFNLVISWCMLYMQCILYMYLVHFYNHINVSTVTPVAWIMYFWLQLKIISSVMNSAFCSCLLQSVVIEIRHDDKLAEDSVAYLQVSIFVEMLSITYMLFNG